MTHAAERSPCESKRHQSDKHHATPVIQGIGPRDEGRCLAMSRISTNVRCASGRGDVHPMIACIVIARIWWYKDKGLQKTYNAEPDWANVWMNTGAWPMTPQYRLRKKRIVPH